MSGITLTENQAATVVQCFYDYYPQSKLNIDLLAYLYRRDMVFTSICSYGTKITSFVIEIIKLSDDSLIPFVLFYHFDRPVVHVNELSLIGWDHNGFIKDLIKILIDFGLLNKREDDNV